MDDDFDARYRATAFTYLDQLTVANGLATAEENVSAVPDRCGMCQP